MSGLDIHHNEGVNLKGFAYRLCVSMCVYLVFQPVARLISMHMPLAAHKSCDLTVNDTQKEQQ